MLRIAARTFARNSSICFVPVVCSRVKPLASKSIYGISYRWLTTPPPMTVSSDLSMERYHKVSDDTMNSLLESLEAFVDLASDKQCEVEYSSGVLTLSLGSKGTYVINKQPPNKQIWLSSPLSGPKRYDYLENNNSWTYARDGKSLGTLLREELPPLLGTDIDIDIN